MSAPTDAVKKKGLRGIAQAFTQPAARTMFFFGFSSGLPFLLVGATLSAWLKDAGIDLTMIGFVSYATLLYTFKFLWAPAVDRLPLPLFGRLGQRRGWLLAAQLVLALGLVGLVWMTPQSSLIGFVALVTLVAFAGATQDIAVDAYRVEIAPIEAQAALASTYTLGYRLALIASGAGTLFLADHAGWQIAYLTLAALLVVPMIAVLRAREPEHAPEKRQAKTAFAALRDGVIGPFQEFFQRCGLPLGLLLLAFVGLFKLPEQMIGVIANPFYLDCGYTKTQIAEVSKVYGVIVSLAGAFAGGFAVSRFGLRGPLLLAALGIGLGNLLYILMALNPGASWAFVLALSGDNLANGFGGTVLVAFLSGLVNRRYTATQYALLSSLANLPGKLIAGFSGVLVKSLSYSGFFALSCVSILPTVLLLLWLRPRLEWLGRETEM